MRIINDLDDMTETARGWLGWFCASFRGRALAF
jgi:hypothetical protein